VIDLPVLSCSDNGLDWRLPTDSGPRLATAITHIESR